MKKKIKFSLFAIMAGLLCVSCNTNKLESAVNKLEKAVEKKDKAAIVEAMKAYQLEEAKKNISFCSAESSISSDDQKEIYEYVANEMSKKYSFLVKEFESYVDKYVDLLSDINKGKQDKIAKLIELEENNAKNKFAMDLVDTYFNDELKTRISHAKTLKSYAETVFALGVYQYGKAVADKALKGTKIESSIVFEEYEDAEYEDAEYEDAEEDESEEEENLDW